MADKTWKKFFRNALRILEGIADFMGNKNIDGVVMHHPTGRIQYWRNPKGSWEKTSYLEVLETIEKINEKAG